MKNEQDFLTTMWSGINAKEWEAKQKQIMHELNKRLLFKEILAYGFIVALLVVGSLITFTTKNNPDIIYVVAALLLSVAFFSEKVLFSKSQGVSIDENRNYY